MESTNQVVLTFQKIARDACEVGYFYNSYEIQNQESVSVEDWLENSWNSYIDFVVFNIGNPFKVEPEDLNRTIKTYQEFSYLNSLLRVYTSLIKQEFAEKEKLIWTGLLEDPGEKFQKQYQIPPRKACTHYLILTNKSLLIKTSNKTLTRKIPIHNVEIEPHAFGFRLTEASADGRRTEVFTFNGLINGSGLWGMTDLNSAKQIPTDSGMKMVAAFSFAMNYDYIKSKLIEEGVNISSLETEEDAKFLEEIWAVIVDGWSFGANMLDNVLDTLIFLCRNKRLNIECIEAMIDHQAKFVLESKKSPDKLINWLNLLASRSEIDSERKATISTLRSQLEAKL